MPLTRPYPIDKAWPNGIDLRKHLSGVFPREGILPDPITVLAAGIAYGNTGWNVAARPFVAVTKRGGAPYSQAYGSALISNDSAANAWVIGGAPVSGTRVDRLWIRATDPTQGESLTTPGGETVPRAVPVFGVTAGTPGIQPLPAGAVEIAQVSTPTGAASIANSTITQTYKFAQGAPGDPIYERTLAALTALTGLKAGDVGYVIADGASYRYTGTAWVLGPQTLVQVSADQPASNIPSGGTGTRFGVLAKNASPLSSALADAFFTVVTGVSGGITVLKDGVYSFAVGVRWPVGMTQRAFVQVDADQTPTWRTMRGVFGVGEDTIEYVSRPKFYTAGTTIPFFVFQSSGATVTMTGATVTGTYLGQRA